MKIIYVPLDERPCNYRQPRLLAEISQETTFLVPAAEYMGSLKKPADVGEIWNWIYSNAQECDYAILSIDTLVYGNIINSRIHHLTERQCLDRLNGLKKLKEINPKIKIYAFNLVARVANYNSDSEDPDYWSKYGAAIWKYSYFLDKKQRGILTADEEKEAANVKNGIPSEILDDFLKRRRVDRYINLSCIDLLKDGTIDSLVIPKDDNAEYGYAAMDHRAVAAKIYENRLMSRVMVYPGADEVGSVLLARVMNEHFGYSPRVYTRYSSTLGPTVVPLLEDRPLNEGIKAQVTSIGGICVDTPKEADFLFAVNSPGREPAWCSDQFERKDISQYTYVNFHEFIRYIEYFIKTYRKPVAVADVVYCNGADNEFMSMLNGAGLLEKLAAYGGWNTTENTNGMCLAHASIASYFEQNGWKGGSKALSQNFLLRKIIEDWLFEANMLYDVIGSKDKFPNVDPYHVEGCEDKVVELMLASLKKYISKELGGTFLGHKISIGNLTLPWHRIFDIDFDLKLE